MRLVTIATAQMGALADESALPFYLATVRCPSPLFGNPETYAIIKFFSV